MKSLRQVSHASFVLVVASLTLVFSLAACERWRRADSKPLDEAGVGFRSIEQLQGMKVTDEEVAELVIAKHAGLPDMDCVELVRIAHARGRPFTDGDEAALLRSVPVDDRTIVELARRDQLGPAAREFHALLLAGFSEATVLELAERRYRRHPTLSPASLAKLKNTGMSEAAILEIVRRGATDAELPALLEAHKPKEGGFRRQPPRPR
jgi:hypothetical protein